ncbi:type IV secretion system protein [Candidatus Vampirococcus lugosii]|uniref:TraG N-terminal Proteobacteria domain-containing protein n=1 Tax=Candidatus Vampirococcus lugosii TaxID=2789015 RepID=A0ABS5QMV3_9BACT|nr:type IV secretion system protein [Candidatus Vampirococcus lugosii]MBS8122497.1 hypothetical protein [Candidatus Vampirococcus lugosii]
MQIKIKIILSFLLLFLIYFLSKDFFILNVYAQSADTSDGDISSIVSILEVIVQFFYIIIRPFISIAGASLSNEFVYGSIFNLDGTLYIFWNMMKNFANYIIAFVFLISIFFYFINYKQDGFNPKSLIPKFLVATVGIQASWFLLAALIDLSTVMTYSIGGLPLTVLDNFKEDEEALMLPVMRMEMGDQGLGGITKSDRTLFYTNPGNSETYATCVTDGQEIDRDYLNENSGSLQEQLDQFDGNYNLNTQGCVFSNRLYGQGGGNNWNDDRDGLIEAGNNLCDPSGDDCYSIKEFTDSVKGFSGPLYTLFGSLSNIADLGVSGVGGGGGAEVGAYSIIAMMKIIIFLALIIPLLTLTIVLIIRGVLMWLIIALAPLLVVSWTFGFNISGSSDKYSMSSVLSLIFLPVIVAFAVSISIIFLTVLNNTLKVGDFQGSTGALAVLGLEKNVDDAGEEKGQEICFKIPLGDEKETNICFNSPENAVGISPFLDILGWIVVNLFAVALMWSIIFAALKSAKLTSGVVNWVDGISKEAFKTAPVIPTPWGSQSIGSLGRVGESLSKQPGQIISRQYAESGIQDTMRTLEGTFSGTNSQGIQNFKNSVKKPGYDSSTFTQTASSAIGAGQHIGDIQEDVLSELKDKDKSGMFNSANSLTDIAQDPDMRSHYNSNYGNIDNLLSQTNRSDGKTLLSEQELKEVYFNLENNMISNGYDKKLSIDGNRIYKSKDGRKFYHFSGENMDVKLIGNLDLDYVDKSKANEFINKIYNIDVDNYKSNLEKLGFKIGDDISIKGEKYIIQDTGSGINFEKEDPSS